MNLIKLLTLPLLFLPLYAAAQTQVQVNNLRHYKTVCPFLNVYAGATDEEANRLATTFFQGVEDTLLEANIAFPKNASESCYQDVLPVGTLGLNFYVQRQPAPGFGAGAFAYQVTLEGTENRVFANKPGAPQQQLGDVVVYNTWLYGVKNDRPWEVTLDRLVTDLTEGFAENWQKAHGQ